MQLIGQTTFLYCWPLSCNSTFSYFQNNDQLYVLSRSPESADQLYNSFSLLDSFHITWKLLTWYCKSRFCYSSLCLTLLKYNVVFGVHQIPENHDACCGWFLLVFLKSQITCSCNDQQSLYHVSLVNNLEAFIIPKNQL